MKDFRKKDADNQENITQEADAELKADANVADNEKFPEDVADRTVEKLQQELTEQKEKYIRLYAEFDNFKRRSAKERIDIMQTAGKEVIISLLDVLDDCERAEKQIQDSGQKDAVTEGVQLVFNKLRSVLQAKGLKPMDVKGQDFDPDKEEAITQIPVTDPNLKGKVVDEVVKGYLLNDKIIRFAKVVVGQ